MGGLKKTAGQKKAGGLTNRPKRLIPSAGLPFIRTNGR